MILRKWEDLPEQMQNDAVKPYYDHLSNFKLRLYLKRLFDIAVSALLLVVLMPLMVVIALAIIIQSGRPVFFRQKRVTSYMREFKILKFRTMVKDAEKLGSQITVRDDARITKVGKFIRTLRLDEIPQLLNVLVGDMSFVGTRPEVPRYVARYSNEMIATLLLPAGVTSEASIMFRNEAAKLSNASNPDDVYVNEVLPIKMRYNLQAIYSANVTHDLITILRTILAVVGFNVKPKKSNWYVEDEGVEK